MAERRRTAVTATAALPPDGRSAMGRASDGLPFRPYVYGGGEPAAVTAARERYRARTAAIEPAAAAAEARLDELAAARHQESVPDIAPGPEWYREMAAEDADELAQLEAARDRYQEAMAAAGPPKPDPVPAPPPVAPAARCRRCHYLTSAVGHKVACDGDG